MLTKDQGGAWLFALSSGFSNLELMPGDAVVVPEKLDRKTAWTNFMVGLKDWTQILYQMGLGIAAVEDDKLIKSINRKTGAQRWR